MINVLMIQERVFLIPNDLSLWLCLVSKTRPNETVTGFTFFEISTNNREVNK